ncbi:PucR family transcriptional regulator [Clavibacter michiganensis]|uniref:PucR family transcriptional regulator n=1 Tax=Clavibacter michiganensis TaxID=28447 RepID=UPI000B381820|nr:helix-turn-helix domain-containing protein [Clavibacter michiganensis]MDO4030834.1 helix-turn-helix domain-containing protein [Clavibacter michiganensis]MDO4080014.1 helix-turn-helix domain-containing protein [Clavibacter michiganensis]MDO4086366.1 helix-turn-helix domain-containing protein [Clavibacter michiganensis]MDO4095330.1 helix-turn-helix domain-containing protein [Clavibacter michiganensis]MWJ02413.1 PucR family transcriptional regulator [Clavibacter michiganensis subsp. michiganen
MTPSDRHDTDVETGETKAETLAWLRSLSGELASATLKRLEDTLPWYGDMPSGRRSAVGLVAQAGITSFIHWYDDPDSTPWIAADVFGAAPRELLRSVSLQQTLQLIRVTVEVVEDRVRDRHRTVRDAILLYSREIAFAAADVYARAAEARGLWDARLEALVVDSILSGEYDDELPSRIAALGWHGHGEVSVLVGTAPAVLDVDQLRRTARHLEADVLIGVQGSRLVLVVGRASPAVVDPEAAAPEAPPVSFLEIATQLEPGFGAGHLVLGHEVPSLVEASRSARAALAGFAVARSWRNAPRPTLADDLLPERALAGDPLARSTLINRIYKPLQAHSTELLATLWCYLDTGRSLEATARELFVHPNTVRYRLKRVSDVIGWDATGAREALILQAALIIGSIAEAGTTVPKQQGSGRARPKRQAAR